MEQSLSEQLTEVEEATRDWPSHNAIYKVVTHISNLKNNIVRTFKGVQERRREKI